MDLTERQKKIIKSRPYRLRHPAGRNISVEFAHMPGKRISTKTDDPEEAIQFADRYLMRDGLLDRDVVPTFAQFAKDFFIRTDDDSQQARDILWRTRKEPDYYPAQQGRLKNYLIPAFGHCLMDGITQEQIERFMINLNKAGRISDDSINKVVLCLRVILDDAVRKRYIPDNPARKVKLINAAYRRRSTFTPAEMLLFFPQDEAKLVATWGGLMWACYFSIMRETGFRPGEVSGLQKKHYLQSQCSVWTDQELDSKTNTVKKRIKTTGKGQDFKIGALSALTCRILDKHTGPMNDEDHLFVTAKGKLVATSTSMKHLRGVCLRLGVDLGDRVQYCFRHTFNTAVIGEVPEDIRRLVMGHTGDRPEYDHRRPQRLAKQLDPYRQRLQDAWDVEER